MKQREYDQAFNVLGNTLCQDPENPKALLTLAAEMQVHIYIYNYIQLQNVLTLLFSDHKSSYPVGMSSAGIEGTIILSNCIAKLFKLMMSSC